MLPFYRKPFWGQTREMIVCDRQASHSNGVLTTRVLVIRNILHIEITHGGIYLPKLLHSVRRRPGGVGDEVSCSQFIACLRLT